MHLPDLFPLAGVLLVGADLGFFGGLFGIGGGILAIPLLVLGFGMEQSLAQGTALVMMVPNLLSLFLLGLALWILVRSRSQEEVAPAGRLPRKRGGTAAEKPAENFIGWLSVKRQSLSRLLLHSDGPARDGLFYPCFFPSKIPRCFLTVSRSWIGSGMASGAPPAKDGGWPSWPSPWWTLRISGRFGARKH